MKRTASIALIAMSLLSSANGVATQAEHVDLPVTYKRTSR